MTTPFSAASIRSPLAVPFGQLPGGRPRSRLGGQMLGEIIRVLSTADDVSREHYPTTLFAQAEVTTGACIARGVIYTAAIAAGMMTGEFTRWLRGLPVDCDLSLNLLASELTVTERARQPA